MSHSENGHANPQNPKLQGLDHQGLDPEGFDPQDLDLFHPDLHPPDPQSPQLESLDINQLHTLGNQAIALGLILGHGYHQGQYEILRKGEIVTLAPQAAVQYLQALIEAHL